MRDITKEERNKLEQLLTQMPTTFKRWKEGAENALVLWAVTLFALFILAALSSWLMKTIFSFSVELSGNTAIWLISIAFVACTSYAIISSINWVKSWEDIRPLIKNDLMNGKVIDEKLHIAEVKRFQEPEHEGLIYFLLTNDDRVFTMYDYESSDLGMNDEDPFSSSFKIKEELNIIQAPATNYLLNHNFSGSPINIEKTLELSAPPKQWPESEAWCDIPWNQLEATLSPE